VLLTSRPETTSPPDADGRPPDAATALAPFLAELFGTRADGSEMKVALEFWDGSSWGPDDAVGTLIARSPDAFRRMLWSPGELGVARAFITGELGVEGDVFEVIAALRDVVPSHMKVGPRQVAAAISSARSLGLIGKPLPPPPEEAHPRGIRHSLRRDAEVVSHHYDVGNEFYRLVLGESMTYSCARFVDDAATLTDAQAAKHELICRKLGLHERSGMRLLDVGCGWGSMAIHAAAHHGASVVGITLSTEQASLARQRVKEAALTDLIEIRLQDYRQLGGETFDAISSIGMFEHVGSGRAPTYFDTLHSLLVPRGRLLNHAISSVSGSKIGRRSFIGRYVFPDGELIDVGDAQLMMERAGFEVRDVESLREHYARTLRNWVANLERDWDWAVELVGERRARVWLLYMAASAVGFEDGGVSIHQVLGVVPDDTGASGMPPTRDGW
jgi:cyclopropane-fatty-acyl-phospholipid synthase